MSRPLLAPSSSSLGNQAAQPSPSPSNASSQGRQQSLSSLMQPVRPSISASSAPTPATAKNPRGLRRIFRDWWLEIGSTFIAIVAVVAIFATLYPHEGQPLPQWRYNLSINALVSIYVVVLKASVLLIVTQGFGQLKWVWFRETRPLKDVEMYDEASRGSVRGALALIWRLRGLQVIPFLGAIVIVITIFSDPIAQQLVHYNQCQRAVPHSSASIPRTNVYSSGSGQVARNGVGTNIPPPEMQAAINAGVFSPEATTIPFTCPTGNCTVPGTFRTMGYCSQCFDVSSELNFTQANGETPRISLPSGLEASPGIATFIMAFGLDSPSTEIVSIAGSTVNPKCPAGNTSWPCSPQAAARCYLYPCVKTFESSISHDQLHERQISKDEDWPTTNGWSNSTIQWYDNVVDMECPDERQKQSLRDIGYQFNDTTKFLPYNVSYDPNAPNPAKDAWSYVSGTGKPPSNETMQIIPPKCIYSISQLTRNGISAEFNDFFNGSINSAPGMTGMTLGLKMSTVVQQLYQGGNATFESISDTFRNVSRAMTVAIRSHGVAGRSDPVVGSVLRTDTCVNVQWAWITFPAGLVVLTLVFFIGVLVQTRPKDETTHHNYKSSALALLFHGLEQRTVDRGLGKFGRASRIAKEAEGIYVQLQGTQRGWGFVEMAGPALRPRRRTNASNASAAPSVSVSVSTSTSTPTRPARPPAQTPTRSTTTTSTSNSTPQMVMSNRI